MDLSSIIADLRNQLQEIDHAILCLERMRSGTRTKRGRPPKWQSAGEPRKYPQRINSKSALARTMSVGSPPL